MKTRFGYIVWSLCVIAVVTLINHDDDDGSRNWNSRSGSSSRSSGGWHK